VSNTRFFFNYLLRHKASYGIGIVFIFLTNLIAVNIPLYIGASVDLLNNYDIAQHQTLVNNVMLMIVLALIMIATRTLSRILFFNPGRDIEREIKDHAFTKLTHLQKDYYSGQDIGGLISIVNNDVNGVRSMAGVGMLQIFNIGFALSLTPVKMWQISPTLTMYCVIPVIITFFITHHAIGLMRLMMRQRMLDLQALSSNAVNLLNGVDVIKSHHIQPWAVSEFEVHNHTLYQRSMQLLKIRTFLMPILGYTDRILKVLILTVGGVYLIASNLTLGELTAMLSYATLLAMPFISLGMIMSAFQMGMVGVQSVRRILDQEIPPQELVHLPRDERDALFSSGIDVKNLSYSYSQTTEEGDAQKQAREPIDFETIAALKNISFEIRPGQKIGVLGKVGSGKTTLVNCLNRYLEVKKGHINIDRYDITELSRKDLRSAVRTITQEPFLFSDTVTENIQFGAGASDDVLLLEDVLFQSDLLDEVQQFPKAEETVVGEKGILLSGGQKQRLSLARALYTPCKLMILDNVLSAVDNETERFLMSQIFENMRSQSTLIVSHRAAVLEQVDFILILHEGEIIARGTHVELLESSDFYRETWELQQQDGGLTA
jgi:ATP-binding cassette subfamily B multidrug efflux pump